MIEAADGVVISNTELNGESVSSVLFDNCQIQDEAVIRAVAKNPAGEDNCSATFIVKSECLTSMPAVSAVEYICCRFIFSLYDMMLLYWILAQLCLKHLCLHIKLYLCKLFLQLL